MDDRELEMSLAQHFGSRLVCKKKVSRSYGAHGYEENITGNDVSLDCLHDTEMKLFDAVDYLNKPAPPAFVAGKLAALRSVMARVKESDQDIEIVIATYADHISRYPADIVADVIDNCIHTQKWFPLVSELCSEIEAKVSYRRTVQKAFERCRNPIMRLKKTA